MANLSQLKSAGKDCIINITIVKMTNLQSVLRPLEISVEGKRCLYTVTQAPQETVMMKQGSHNVWGTLRQQTAQVQ